MAIPKNREEFVDHCLRKLGAPVIQINVSELQIDDRVDEAIYFWTEYHHNGSEKLYLKYQLTSTDLSRGYVEIPDNVFGVTRIFDLDTTFTGSGLWDATYQFMISNASELANGAISNYFMVMSHIELLQEWLVGKPMIRYNRHMNRLYVDVTGSDLVEGSYLVIEAYGMIDQLEYSRMWSDRWLQNYATVLIKENWGEVLAKYGQMQLVSGTNFNGERILQEAREDRKMMEEEAIRSLGGVIGHYIG